MRSRLIRHRIHARALLDQRRFGGRERKNKIIRLMRVERRDTRRVAKSIAFFLRSYTPKSCWRLKLNRLLWYVHFLVEELLTQL